MDKDIIRLEKKYHKQEKKRQKLKEKLKKEELNDAKKRIAGALNKKLREKDDSFKKYSSKKAIWMVIVAVILIIRIIIFIVQYNNSKKRDYKYENIIKYEFHSDNNKIKIIDGLEVFVIFKKDEYITDESKFKKYSCALSYNSRNYKIVVNSITIVTDKEQEIDLIRSDDAGLNDPRLKIFLFKTISLDRDVKSLKMKLYLTVKNTDIKNKCYIIDWKKNAGI